MNLHINILQFNPKELSWQISFINYSSISHVDKTEMHCWNCSSFSSINISEGLDVQLNYLTLTETHFR